MLVYDINNGAEVCIKAFGNFVKLSVIVFNYCIKNKTYKVAEQKVVSAD